MDKFVRKFFRFFGKIKKADAAACSCGMYRCYRLKSVGQCRKLLEFFLCRCLLCGSEILVNIVRPKAVIAQYFFPCLLCHAVLNGNRNVCTHFRRLVESPQFCRKLPAMGKPQKRLHCNGVRNIAMMRIIHFYGTEKENA